MMKRAQRDRGIKLRIQQGVCEKCGKPFRGLAVRGEAKRTTCGSCELKRVYGY